VNQILDISHGVHGENGKYKSHSNLEKHNSELLIPLIRIPWVPDVPDGALGPGMNRVLQTIWWDARGRLRECRCGICVRGHARARGSLGI